MMNDLNVSITNCARCGENHPNLFFKAFLYPIIDECNGEETIWTHWVKCPKSGDPVLFRVTPEVIDETN